MGQAGFASTAFEKQLSLFFARSMADVQDESVTMPFRAGMENDDSRIVQVRRST